MLGRVNDENEDDRHIPPPPPPPPSSLYFWDVPKSWTVETIALLLNKTVVVFDDRKSHHHDEIDDDTAAAAAAVENINVEDDQDDDEFQSIKISPKHFRLSDGQARVRITRLTKPDDPNVPRLVADVEFASKEERDNILRSYQGLPIPETHGYNHFDFTTTKHMSEEEDVVNEDMDISSDCGCGRGNDDTTISVPSPPLHLQILALPTKELEKRISKYGLMNSPNESSCFPSSNKSVMVSSKGEEKSRKDDECYLPSLTTKVSRGKGKINKVRNHALMAHIWTELLKQESFSSPRRHDTVKQLGIPVHEETSNLLLEYLRNIPPYEKPPSSSGRLSKYTAGRHECTEEEISISSRPKLTWPLVSKQRKGVQSQHYLTVRQRHPPEYDEIWDLCRQLLVKTLSLHIHDFRHRNNATNDDNNGSSSDSQIPNYNALAITKNFHGSPHIDAHDQTFQHVVALGDFDGGNLCCELESYNKTDYVDNGNAKDNGKGNYTQELEDVHPSRTELNIEIKNRLGRMDGRSVHWVSGWEGKERYSIVYYSTNKAHYTDPVPQSTHVEWMKMMNSRTVKK